MTINPIKIKLKANVRILLILLDVFPIFGPPQKLQFIIALAWFNVVMIAYTENVFDLGGFSFVLSNYIRYLKLWRNDHETHSSADISGTCKSG